MEIKTADHLFARCIEIATKVMQGVPRFESTSDKEHDAKLVAMFFYVKSLKTFTAIKLLWTNGYEEDAITLSRTLFEIMLQIRYLMEEPLEKAKEFVEFYPIALLKFRKKNKDQLDSISVERKDNIKQILEEMDKLDLPNKRNWWGGSIKDLADRFGDEMTKWYDIIYWEECNLAHPSILSINRYVSRDEKGVVVLNCFPYNSGDLIQPKKICFYFLHTLDFMNDMFALDLKEDLESYMEELNKIEN